MPTLSNQLFSIPIEQQITPYLSLRKKDELDIIVISHPKLRAAISMQGAHLIAWQPSGQAPIIWLSDNSEFKSGKAIRGGVPICWPWFGKVAQPAHGFARNLPWELTAHDEDENGVWLTFTLRDNAQTQQLWPHEFSLIARFKLGNTCDIELESYGDFTTTTALHSYFDVADIQQTTISGLGNHYIDKVLNQTFSNGETRLTFTGELDRIYTAPEFCSVIEDQVRQRTIEVHHQHFNEIGDVVVWNPGATGSIALADMPNNGYKTMVCVETARISQPLVTSEKHPMRLAVNICYRDGSTR